MSTTTFYRVVDKLADADPALVSHDELRTLLGEWYDLTEDGIGEAVQHVIDGDSDSPEALDLLGLDLAPVSVDDLEDHEWGLLVWRATRDGGAWVETSRISLTIRVAGSKDATGLSRVRSPACRCSFRRPFPVLRKPRRPARAGSAPRRSLP